MSPEQYRCENADSRSDQFSFCVALYEALFGQRPFAGNSLAELAAEVTAGRVRKIPAGTQVAVPLQQTIMKGLSAKPEDRFASMADLLQSLDPAAESDPEGARRFRRNVSLVMGGSTLVLSGASLRYRSALAFTVPNLVLVMGLVVGIFGIALLYYRRSLLASPFARGLTRLTLLGVSTVFFVRCMAWFVNLQLLQLLPIDLLVFGGTIGVVSLQYLRRLWPLWPLCWLAAVVSLSFPAYAHVFANSIYTLAPIAFIYGWYVVADRLSRPSAPSSQASSSARISETR